MRSVVVLGPFRGGTSLVTGILQSLGVFVGRSFFDARTGYPTYEALWLREQCLKCFDEREGHWGYRCEPKQRTVHLREWSNWARKQAWSDQCPAFGGKHPTMCMLVDDLAKGWQNKYREPPLFLAVRRPFGDVIHSWENARTPHGRVWWPRSDMHRIVEELITTRDESLKRHDHLAINFDELRSSPLSIVKRIAEYCNLDPARVPQAAPLVRRN
jgi:hypothetical protein